MTACPIRYQRQVSDRKGKIFYTSITSLSHISKVTGYEATYGRWRCSPYRYYIGAFTFRSFLRDLQVEKKKVSIYMLQTKY